MLARAVGRTFRRRLLEWILAGSPEVRNRGVGDEYDVMGDLGGSASEVNQDVPPAVGRRRV